jgi:hypothetical protein
MQIEKERDTCFSFPFGSIFEVAKVKVEFKVVEMEIRKI